MSEVDSKLDAAWRAASRDEPPAAIDDALRAAARRAVHAVPSRTRHQRTWPLAAAAVVAVLAISIVQLTPTEQVAPPTILADSTARQTASREQQAMVAPAAPAAIDAARRADAPVAPAPAPVERASSARKELAQPAAGGAAPAPRPASAPPPAPAGTLGDKTQIDSPNNASAGIAGAPVQTPERDAALKLKRDEGSADASVKQERANPFPAAPAENKNATDTFAPSPSPPTVAAASKPAASPSGASGLTARAARSEEPAASSPQTLAKAAPERAKDAAPLPPEEWIKRIRRMQDEGRKDDVVKELAAFRAAYKDRADALLPLDLRELK
jgi:hypothetical protein